MSDPLFRVSDGGVVKPNELIKDRLGRDWQFHFADRYGVRTEGAEVWVKRITNGRAAKEPSFFKVDFFPDYIVEQDQ